MRAREAHQQSYDNMSWLFDTIWEMVVAVTKLEKRHVEAETLAEAFDL